MNFWILSKLWYILILLKRKLIFCVREFWDIIKTVKSKWYILILVWKKQTISREQNFYREETDNFIWAKLKSIFYPLLPQNLNSECQLNKTT